MSLPNASRVINDAVEVTVIFIVFVLVYTAVTIGAVGTPILKGFRLLKRPSR